MTDPPQTTHVKDNSLRKQQASRSLIESSDERGFLCGNVDQQPVFVVRDVHNGERRPFTRQQWVYMKFQRRLPEEWKRLDESIDPASYRFANHGVMHAFSNLESNSTYYCGLLPHNVMPWTVTFRSYEAWINASLGAAPAGAVDAVSKSGQRAPYADVPPTRRSRYEPADIAIGVYTALRFLRTRAHAARDTYLARHPANRVFFYTGGNDSLGLFDVVAVPGAGESYNSAFGKQMHALVHMWEHANDAKWFYVIGCDTYVFMDYLLPMLDPYDADEPHILGCCAGNFSLAAIGMKRDPVWFGSGGAGIFLSRALMAKIVPKVDEFVKRIWPPTVPSVDVATAYLAKLQGHVFELVNNMFATTPEQALKHHHPGTEIENAVWHFMHPTKMFDLDEFYLNQKLDRLARMPAEHAARLLLEFSRDFVRTHFRTQRRAYYERRIMAGMLGDYVSEVRFHDKNEQMYNEQQQAHLGRILKVVRSDVQFWYPSENVNLVERD
jgi:hypothetical protein